MFESNATKKSRVTATIALTFTLALFLGTACKDEPLPMPQPEPPRVVTPKPVVKPTPPATQETAIATKEAAPVKRNIRVYEDEKNPTTFVELTEFTTGCTDMGDIFAKNELVLNPKLDGTQTIPLDRVVSITFGNFGLIDPLVIKGVGAITQPAGYRDNEIALRNPDEKLMGIVVICRQLKGVKTDGTEWKTELLHDVAKKFYKIELVEAP